ncbi:MAG: T9SS type A sorting domain-containing protein, partial [Candidatus Cloacimonetes bacterium]|nr:T9SS type A sorting domain-containing protein [Candidatus Cloacimonadota bacterium]
NKKPYYQRLSENEYIFYFNGAQLMKWEGELVEIDQNVITINQSCLACYPNPFNPEVTISFTVSGENENASINVYNAKGQRVRELRIMGKELGVNSVVWDGCNETGKRMASGIYFVTLNLNGKTMDFKKITMIK